MKRVILAISIAVALASLLPATDGQPENSASTPAAANPAPDVQDLLFLSDTRPILIRLHIRIDNKPFREIWDDFIASLFRYLDADGDGVLNQDEIDRAPRPQLLQQLLRGNYFDPNATRNRQTAELGVQLVAGKVTRQGLASYYRLSGVEPFLAFYRDHTQRSGPLTEAMMRHLNRNKDGKLSREEAQAAPRSLRKLDLNDDEVIDRDEVLPNASANDPNRPVQRERIDMLTEDSPFILIQPDSPPTQLPYAMLTRYDKDKDQKLSRDEIKLDRAVFDQLDVNKDGELSGRELMHLALCLPPDIEIIIEFRGSTGDQPQVYLATANGSLVGTTDRSENGGFAVRHDAHQLDVGLGGGAQTGFQEARQLLMEQFASADVTKRGYLDKVQIEQNPLLRAVFPFPETAGNVKLTARELSMHVDLLGKALASCTVLLITDHGQDLFEMLNVYHDGRLRQNELHATWARLAPWDKAGAGYVTREHLPHLFDLLFTQGQPGNLFQVGDPMAPAPPTVEAKPAPPTRGPIWFRKMDRNGDGVVSMREFLGSREDFKRIDTNGDGVISAEEAEQADAQMRKAKGQQTPPNR